MALSKTALATLAGSALLGTTAIASAQNSCSGNNLRPVGATPGGVSCSSSNTISLEQQPGQNPVLLINGQRVDDSNIELAPDGRIFVRDGNGNRVDVFAQLGPMINNGFGAMPTSVAASNANWSAQQYAAKPVIGVRLQRVTPGLAAHLGLAQGTGLLIAGVHPDLPAAQAGLQQWDVITNVGGTPVSSADGLTAMLSQVEPGTGITIDCIRHGVATTITVAPTMVNIPAQQAQAWPAAPRNPRELQAMINATMQRNPAGNVQHKAWPGTGTQQLKAIPTPPAGSAQRQQLLQGGSTNAI